MSEQQTITPEQALAQIRERARFGLNSDPEGARNALLEITRICDRVLAERESEDGVAGSAGTGGAG